MRQQRRPKRLKRRKTNLVGLLKAKHPLRSRRAKEKNLRSHSLTFQSCKYLLSKNTKLSVATCTWLKGVWTRLLPSYLSLNRKKKPKLKINRRHPSKTRILLK